MTTVAEARGQLEAALAAQGLRVIPAGGQVAPPCVFVLPGDPWLAPAQLGGRYRTFGQRILGLVGTSSDQAQLDDTEAMAEALANAIHASPPWTLATIGPPFAYDVGGVGYLAIPATTTMQGPGGAT